jgi:integrase
MVKRANGEGTVYQRQNGTWCAQITIRDIGQGPLRKTLYGKSQREVLAKKREIERAMEAGLPQSTRQAPTLREYGEAWIDGALRSQVALGHLSPRTRDSYAANWKRHIAPTLGPHRIDKLTPAAIRSWMTAKIAEPSARGGRLSPRTVQYLHGILRKALNDAMRDELISRNVALLVKPPRQEHVEVQPLTPAEAQAVLVDTTDDYYVLWLTLLTLGLRLGEALALEWSDFADDWRTVKIERAVARLRDDPDPATGRHKTKIVVKAPKTARSRATMAVPAFLAEALRAHKARQAERRLAQPRWDQPSLVFTTSVGSHLDGRNVLREWKAVCRRAGIERNVRIHDLRHTTGSWLLARGVDMRVVMEILRHTRISTTSDIYAHVLDEVKHDAACAMDDMLRDLTGTD